jgi:MerR family transcriptional regulator, copper efflux regulator
MQRLTIGRLARLGGVNLETVRYYERRGLLPKPPRTQAGYRQFPAETVDRLHFIKRAQELGFSLEEISELLALRIEPEQKRAHVRARAMSKIAELEGKIEALTAMKSKLRDLVEQCERYGSDGCPILASMASSKFGGVPQPDANRRGAVGESVLTDSVVVEFKQQSADCCLLCLFDSWDGEEWD